jgi:ribosomal protein L19
MTSAPASSTNIIQDFERRQMEAIAAQRRVPKFAPGDTVKVMVKVIETDVEPKDKKRAKGCPRDRPSACRPTREW